MPEQWRDVPGYEGHYQVSDLGRVKSLARNNIRIDGSANPIKDRILRGTPDGWGYLTYHLSRNNKPWNVGVHRLILLAFIGPPPEDRPYACHRDDDPKNNTLSNLRWASPSDNIRDSVRNGTNFRANKTHCKHGHAFTPQNTQVSKRTGARRCKECMRLAGNVYRARLKREAMA